MKRVPLAPALNVVIVFLSVILLFAGGAWAKPTTPEQVRGVVQNWLGKEVAPMGATLGVQIREVQTFNDSDGNPVYYVVCLNPSGLVFVSADDLVEPIIGFVSGATSYDPSSRLGTLVSGDIPARVLQARTAAPQIMQQGAARAPQTPETPETTAQTKWALLAAPGPTLKAAPLSPTVSAPGSGPVITGISPTGHVPGTFTVTLIGSNFTGVTDVTCFEIATGSTVGITSWNFISDTQIIVTGTFPVGGYYFWVTTPNGIASSILQLLQVAQFGVPSLSDVRVAPFIQTRWGSTTTDGSQPMTLTPTSLPCYNYFTPPYPPGSYYNYLNYPVGAGATAQLLRFWQYPTAGVGTGLFTITVDGGESTWPLRGGDGLGAPYQWSNMPLDPLNTPGLTDLQRQAIGSLCHDIDLSVNMDYEWQYDGKAYIGTDNYRMADVAKALVATFKYGNAMAGGNAGKDIPYTNRDNMIIPNLHAGYPVVLGVTSTRGSDFIDVVCDGYGYNYNSIYHHLNIGYGFNDAWYSLPLVYLSTTDNKLQFNILTDIIYNVYPSGSGEIIAGRVTDTLGNPVSGATVTATRSAGGVYTATTNANGIYAIVKVPSSSSYNVIAAKAGLGFAVQSVSTGASATGTINTGNVWGVDFVAGAISLNPLNQALDNNTLGFNTGGNANWFEQANTTIKVPYFGLSCAQSGAIATGQSSSLQTSVQGPGTLSFYWSVSCNPLFPSNKLILYLDGVAQDSISGGVGWTQKTVSIPQGVHTVTWTYSKSVNNSSFYNDSAWVDKVVFQRGGGMVGIYELLLF